MSELQQEIETGSSDVSVNQVVRGLTRGARRAPLTDEAVMRPPSDWMGLNDRRRDPEMCFAQVVREVAHNAYQNKAKTMELFCLNHVRHPVTGRDGYSEYLVCANDGLCVSTQELVERALMPGSSLSGKHGTHGSGMKASAFLLCEPTDAQVIFLSRTEPGSDEWVGAEMKYLGGKEHRVEVVGADTAFWSEYMEEYTPTRNAIPFEKINVFVLIRYVRGIDSARARRPKSVKSDGSMITVPRAMLSMFLSSDVIGQKKIKVLCVDSGRVCGEDTSHLGFETYGAKEKDKIRFFDFPSLDEFFGLYMLDGTEKTFDFKGFKYTKPESEREISFDTVRLTLRYLPTLLSGRTTGSVINFGKDTVNRSKENWVYPRYDFWVSGDFEFGCESRVAEEPVFFAKDSSRYLKRVGLYWAGVGGQKRNERNFSQILSQLKKFGYPHIDSMGDKNSGSNWELGNNFMLDLRFIPKSGCKDLAVDSLFLASNPDGLRAIVDAFFDWVTDKLEVGKDPIALSLKKYADDMTAKYAPERDQSTAMPNLAGKAAKSQLAYLEVLDPKTGNNLHRIMLTESPQTVSVLLRDPKTKKLIESPNVRVANTGSGMTIVDGGFDRGKRRVYYLQVPGAQIFDAVMGDFVGVSLDEFKVNVNLPKETRKKYRPLVSIYIEVDNVNHRLNTMVNIGKVYEKKVPDDDDDDQDETKNVEEEKESFEGSVWGVMNSELLGEYDLGKRQKRLVLNEAHELFARLRGYDKQDRRLTELSQYYHEAARQFESLFSVPAFVEAIKGAKDIEDMPAAEYFVQALLRAKFDNKRVRDLIDKMAGENGN